MTQTERTQTIQDLERQITQAKADLQTLEDELESITNLLGEHTNAYNQARDTKAEPATLVNIKLRIVATKDLLTEQETSLEVHRKKIADLEAELQRHDLLAQLYEVTQLCVTHNQAFESKIAQFHELLKGFYAEMGAVWNGWTDTRAKAAQIILALKSYIAGSNGDDYGKRIIEKYLSREGIDVINLEHFFGPDYSGMNNIRGGYWTNNMAVVFTHGERRGILGNLVIESIQQVAKARR